MLSRISQTLSFCHKKICIKAEESNWFNKRGGNPFELKKAEELATDQQRMPGKAKKLTGNVKREGNVGNLLHSHVTLDHHFQSLYEHDRWD